MINDFIDLKFQSKGVIIEEVIRNVDKNMALKQ